MADHYSQSVIKLIVAQVCKSLGWDAINNSALDVMVDFAEKHIQYLGRQSKRYAEQFGRVDPALEDLELVFKEENINVKEIIEFTKNVEPLTVPHKISKFPAPSQTKLIFPNDETVNAQFQEELLNPHHKQEINGHDDENAASKISSTISPARSSSRSRFSVGSTNKALFGRSLVNLDDADISSLLSSGKPPAANPPPKPYTDIPKVKIEPLLKPKVISSTPKLKIKEEPELKNAVIQLAPLPVKVEKQKKKKDKKKIKEVKKAVVAKKSGSKTILPPEGFDAIFGQTLEKPSAVSTDVPKFVSQMEVKTEPLPDGEDESVNDTPDLSPGKPLDSANPEHQSRMSSYDDIISSVIASTREEIKKTEAAEEIFSFDDRPPFTPPEAVKPAKPASKSQTRKPRSPHAAERSSSKGRSKSRSRSPIKLPPKKLQIDNSSESGFKASAPSEKETPPSPMAESTKEKPKKATNSRRQQLLEKLQQALLSTGGPSEDFSSEIVETPPKVIEKAQTEHVIPSLSHASATVSEESEPARNRVNDSPSHDEEEEVEVNVDEDSDVDVLGASGHIPVSHNPYAVYQSNHNSASASPVFEVHDNPPTPPFIQNSDDRHQLRYSGEEEYDNRWTESNVREEPYVNSQTIDFNSPQYPAEFKEKHKKEKKEKKEKKKKKHKERDKDKSDDNGRHKSKKIKAQESVPKLTLKIGSQHMTEVSSHQMQVEDYSQPKLVIKPFGLHPSAHEMESSFEEAYDLSHVTSQTISQTNQAEVKPVVVAEDGKVWICPACSRPDDGSPMIGCDGCDEWFHWPCVNIVSQPPEDVEWFCPKCAKKEKKKKKKKKKDKYKQ